MDTTPPTAERQATTKAETANWKHQIGAVIEVRNAYRGGGHYAPDGNEGIYTVVGHLAPADYYLVKGIDHDAMKSDWDLICHESRITATAFTLTKPIAPKYSPAARELAAYHADIYKAKRNARVAKKGGLR